MSAEVPQEESDTHVSWKNEDGVVTAWVKDPESGDMKPVIWAPMPGSQEQYLRCPIFEVLYEGTRGPGKTDALLFDFVQHCGPDSRSIRQRKTGVPQVSGWGADWSGLILRQTYPQLADIIAKSKKWFSRFPKKVRPEYNEQKTMWRWPTGETLTFSHMKVADDYYKFHGHSYPFIGFEELTTWPDLTCYLLLMSCCRSTAPGMPRKYRATTNPYGPGHNVVKKRFQLPCPPQGNKAARIGRLVKEADKPERIAIHGYLDENFVLMKADPNYKERLREAARNPSELAAWLDGSWDIVAGGMFDDMWTPRHHVLPDIPFSDIPSGWKLYRSYDHGQSKPFSYGLHAVSNGEPYNPPGTDRLIGQIRGDVVRLAEWYGCHRGQSNVGVRFTATQIATGILNREADWGVEGRVRPGPADEAIWSEYAPDQTIAGEFEKAGLVFTKSGKGSGSRKIGWEQCRTYLKNALPNPLGGPRENPGYFVCERCVKFLETVPVLPRDGKEPDDVDTDAEDHIADEFRYMLRADLTEDSLTKSWR